MTDLENFDLEALAANTATPIGTVKDSDGQTWNNAIWTMRPVHSSGQKVVYLDGTPAIATSGQLDNTGTFTSGQMPLTSQMLPPGATLTITICSVTSAPCQVIPGIQTTAATNLGNVLSPLIQAPRIQAGPIVYAYSTLEILNAESGCGYINTSSTPFSSWVFVGETWQPSGINTADVAFLDQPNVFTQQNTFENGILIAGGLISSTGALRLDAASGQDVELNFFGAGNATDFGNGAGGIVGSIDKSGNFFVIGNATTGPLQVEGPVALTNNVEIQANNQVNWPQGQCLIGVPSSHLIINPGGSTGAILLNWNNGAGVQFGNGAGVEIGGIDPAGNLHVNGNLSCGGSKPFIIDHPLYPDKKLTHVCIEGPECAVYYRGEGETRQGAATIILPDYFEALTRREGRTVQLTAILEGDDDDFGILAASRVVNGKFAVMSSLASQKFYWEVKAVRSDVELLDVAPDRINGAQYAESQRSAMECHGDTLTVRQSSKRKHQGQQTADSKVGSLSRCVR